MTSENSNRSNVLAATIIAVGLVVAAVIIAKPQVPASMRSAFPPIAISSVRQEFVARMQPGVGQAHVLPYSKRSASLERIEVDRVSYDAQAQQYRIRYYLNWNTPERTVTWTGCYLARANSASSTFTGSCPIGADISKDDDLYREEAVSIAVQ